MGLSSIAVQQREKEDEALKSFIVFSLVGCSNMPANLERDTHQQTVMLAIALVRDVFGHTATPTAR
jgi:uncharacterized protein YcfL